MTYLNLGADDSELIISYFKTLKIISLKLLDVYASLSQHLLIHQNAFF